jgi:hypothetical protein
MSKAQQSLSTGQKKSIAHTLYDMNLDDDELDDDEVNNYTTPFNLSSEYNLKTTKTDSPNKV